MAFHCVHGQKYLVVSLEVAQILSHSCKNGFLNSFTKVPLRAKETQKPICFKEFPYFD